jgi:LAO/AO transport system kinase
LIDLLIDDLIDDGLRLSSFKKHAKLIFQSDLRGVARALTLVEDDFEKGAELIAYLKQKSHRKNHSAKVIGITGPPGAGKSTLVDKLASHYASLGEKVAILAIDPTSPFSGGAVLGDRIRMSGAELLKLVFVRSMASRGALGGLSLAVPAAVEILEAAAFDTIFVETVGVGQAEVSIVKQADCCIVVLVPGMGDAVQSVKAGILEIPDIFVVNKGDLAGADLVVKDIFQLIKTKEEIKLKVDKSQWKKSVLKIVAVSGEGVASLVERIDQFFSYASKKAERDNHQLFVKAYLHSFLLSQIEEQKELLAKYSKRFKSGKLSLLEMKRCFMKHLLEQV